MRSSTRNAAALALTAAVSAAAAAQVPPPATPPMIPPPAVAAPAAPPPANEPRPTGVAAKVNGQEIPEVAVYRALRQFPPAERELARREILNHLVENHVIDQYLTALKITAEPAEVDKLIGELKAELQKGMKDYQKELDALMLTEAEFRAEAAAQMKWDKFVKQQGTDAALKQLYDAAPQIFDGSLVRARHILINPGVDPAKVEETKKTLVGIKQAVEAEAAKAVPAAGDALAKEQARGAKAEEVFGEYAKKHSTCGSAKSGGDIGFFPRVGAMVEPFAKTAFDMQPFQMSEVVQTEFGLHLILVTAKKPGVQRKFDDVKPDVQAVYAMKLREAVLAQMKPKATIEIVPQVKK